MIAEKLASCHCLQNGHWKSLAMTSQTCAVVSPKMRPRSARSLMLSRNPDPAGDVLLAAAATGGDAARPSVVRLTVPAAVSVRPHAATSAGSSRVRSSLRGMGVGDAVGKTAEERLGNAVPRYDVS